LVSPAPRTRVTRHAPAHHTHGLHITRAWRTSILSARHRTLGWRRSQQPATQHKTRRYRGVRINLSTFRPYAALHLRHGAYRTLAHFLHYASKPLSRRGADSGVSVNILRRVTWRKDEPAGDSPASNSWACAGAPAVSGNAYHMPYRRHCHRRLIRHRRLLSPSRNILRTALYLKYQADGERQARGCRRTSGRLDGTNASGARR